MVIPARDLVPTYALMWVLATSIYIAGKVIIWQRRNRRPGTTASMELGYLLAWHKSQAIR